MEKTLRSALANALSRNASKEALRIKSIEVSGGPAYKRYHPSTRGRIHPYKKRTSHITVILSDEVNSKVKSEKSKGKSRGVGWGGINRLGRGEIGARLSVLMNAIPVSVCERCARLEASVPQGLALAKPVAHAGNKQAAVK